MLGAGEDQVGRFCRPSLAAFVPPSTPAQPHVDGGLTPVPEVQAPAPEAPHTPTDPPFSATPAGDNPAGVGKQPDAVGRGDTPPSSGSLADGSRGDAGAGSVGAGGVGYFRAVEGGLVVSAYLSVGSAFKGRWPLGSGWRPVGWRR